MSGSRRTNWLGAVAQVQATVHAALKLIGDELRPEEEDGTPTGEALQAVQPRSFVVVGTLSQLASETGINKSKLRAFELYRRNLIRPEIVTFDELYHRARFIVENA